MPHFEGDTAWGALEAARGAQDTASVTRRSLNDLMALLAAKGVITQGEFNVLRGWQ